MTDPVAEAIPWMRRADESHMRDQCMIYDYTDGPLGRNGRPEEIYTARSQMVPCNFRKTVVTELLQKSQIEDSDANVLFPLHVEIERKARLQVVSRLTGEVGEMFEVIGEPHLGFSSKYCRLQKVKR